MSCACGSGLRPARCCGLDPRAIPDAFALPWLTGLLGEARAGAERGEEAALLALLELAPTHPEGLRLLYARRAAQGREPAARALLERFVSAYPNELWGRCELALLLMRAGDDRGVEHARNAVRLAPSNPRAHDVLGMVLIESHRPQAGAWHCARAVELSERRDPILLGNMAWGLKSQGRLEEARAAYREAAAIAPDTLQVNLGWAQTEIAARDFPLAETLLERAEHAAPGHAGVLAAKLSLLEGSGRHGEALALIDAQPAMSPDLHLARGRVLDRLGRYDEAFAAMEAGKRLYREQGGRTYPAEEVAALLARLAGFYTPRRAALLPRANRRADMPQPIFILGFPRSGTTMTEQALTAHPMVAAGDELPLLGEVAENAARLLGSPLHYPEALAELWMGDRRDGLDVLRDHYLRGAARLGAVHEGVPFFTDKMPLNETQLGLASLIFPHSPMIHVLRHPLDVTLSVFGTMLTHGFHCASDLHTIALHYARIAELTDQVREAMQPRYLSLRYEDLVEDLEAGMRRLTAFAGLPFDAACLQFHENRRYARTASQHQVAEPLYTRSRFRWRNYARQLEPVMGVLRPAIERLGYTVG
jgi:tetratricopeptide (TPR) repeat protein